MIQSINLHIISLFACFIAYKTQLSPQKNKKRGMLSYVTIIYYLYLKCQFSLHFCFYICIREETMSYKFDSLVTRHEADALKEMIFRRVRERSENMTDDVQQDIMDIARDSFISQNNPFSKIAAEKQPEETKLVQSHEDSAAKENNIGFPVREIKSKLTNGSRIINEQISQAAIENNMLSAREALSKKQGFMGALNFLNSQAAISLIRTRADKFEILA